MPPKLCCSQQLAALAGASSPHGGGAGRAGLGHPGQAKSAAGPDPSAVTREYPLPGGNNEVRAEGKNKPKGDGSRANTSVNNPVPQDHTLPGWDTGVAQGLTRYIHEAFW